MSEFNGDRKCDAAGEALIKSFEQYSASPYPDPGSPLGQACAKAGLKMSDYQNIPNWQSLGGDPWTQGWGHTKGVLQSSPDCTDDQAEGWFKDDLEESEFCINENVRYHISNNQFSALCSLVFNIGTHNFERSSALTLLNKGDMADVPAHIRLWEKDHYGHILNGLARRREAEITLFDTPIPRTSKVTMTIQAPDPVTGIATAIKWGVILVCVCALGYLIWDNSSLRETVATQKLAITDLTTANNEWTEKSKEQNASIKALKDASTLQGQKAQVAIGAAEKNAQIYYDEAAKIVSSKKPVTDECQAVKDLFAAYLGGEK